MLKSSIINSLNDAFNNNKILIDTFKYILNIENEEYLNKYKAKSYAIKQMRFGNTMQLFAPLYLSNTCKNVCTYCGFSVDNKIARKILNPTEIEVEARVLQQQGFEHILIVTGEDNSEVGLAYLLKAIYILKKYFSIISVEVQPLETEDYIQLKDAGVHTIIVYQETYNKETYLKVHPKGKKRNFEYRLDTPDRIGDAGIHKIGLGILIGLHDNWQNDLIDCALHINYLQKKYWQSRFSISFPRLRPFEGEFEPACTITEFELKKIIIAFRICFPDIDIILSTRERPEFRNEVLELGITTMSAGSKTSPGAYQEQNNLEQFAVNDNRTLAEIVSLLKLNNIEPVFKDWDYCLA
ncbi:MAG: 2-iminoacetate synthase ThiH [Chitinophagales bacterium]|nr:2-iminoacetate synthase ThiH [Chitinophagales bacterium]